ncbi:MAG: cyclic nucleotide-binding domain-containing protein [Kouleothrix sp.]|jgi:CRP-like cAMP-binding protein
MSYVDLLKTVDIFDELDTARLERLSGICTEHWMRVGEVVFEQQSHSDSLYIILNGEIDILVQLPTMDTASVIARLQRGQSFGEVALVDEGLRTATARVASPEARLLMLHRANLMELCHSDYELGFLLMRNLAIDLALKLRQADLRVPQA